LKRFSQAIQIDLHIPPIWGFLCVQFTPAVVVKRKLLFLAFNHGVHFVRIEQLSVYVNIFEVAWWCPV